MSTKNDLTEFIDVSSQLLKTLSDLQYGADTLTNYRRILNRIGVYMKEHGLSTYSENVGMEFLKHQLDKGPISDSYLRTLRVTVQRLNDTYFKNRYIRRHGKPEIALPFEWYTVLSDYLLSCKQHGNHENTIKNKRRFCVCFLSALSSLGIQNLAELETGTIVRACLMLKNKASYAEVRRFLTYLDDTQIVCSNFSHVVPRYIRPVKLPSIYPPSDIHRLENSIDQSTAVGIRNYAVLLLASRLGIRSGDIVNLKFDNLDFPNEKIRFLQQKTGDIHELPLILEVKYAVLNYLNYARPAVDSQFVFINTVAPYLPITTGVIRNMLKKAFVSADIDFQGKKHGPHSLRSSLASSLVNDDVPYEAVRKILGHTDPRAIVHYARIDLEKLRMYAIDAPRPSGNLKKLLYGEVAK